MSKLNTKETERIIPMPIDPTYKVIIARDNRMYKELVIITGINEKDYNKIKHGESIKLERGNCTFIVDADHVLCFGEIDFHAGSEDSKVLDAFDWLDHLGAKGICIPSRYNYDKHECTTYNKRYLHTETWKNSTLCRYFHGCLGKPQFTLIFVDIK